MSTRKIMLGLVVLGLALVWAEGCSGRPSNLRPGGTSATLGVPTTRPAVELAVPAIAAPPAKLDGRLDDPFWQKAAVAADFRLIDGKAAASKTRVLVARCERTLFVAVECFADAKALASLKADIKERDGEEIWNDDDVELFIDPSGRRRSYYHILVNPAGTIYDAYHPWPGEGDIWWNGKYSSAVVKTPTSWIAQFAIPLAAFDRTKEFASDWAFNVVCNRTAQNEAVTWAPVGPERLDQTAPAVHKPLKFGGLSGLPPGANASYHSPASRVVRIQSSTGPAETCLPAAAARQPAESGEAAALALFDPHREADPRRTSQWVDLAGAPTSQPAGAAAKFTADAGAGLIYHLPRDIGTIWDKPVFAISSDCTVWSGYKELVIDCVNESPSPVKLDVLMEDLTAYYLFAYTTVEPVTADDGVKCWQAARKYWLGQLAATEATARPGRSELRLPLHGKFMTSDGRREISLCEIWGVGLRAKSPGKALRIEGMRLEGGRKGLVGLVAIWPAEATPLPKADKYPDDRYAQMASLGINDPNATHCPFSGTQLKDKAFEPGEKAGALRIYPRVDAIVTPEGGEGVYGDPAGPDRHITWYLHGSGLHHYANSIWESRSLMYFDLTAIPKGAKIKSIQLRLPSRCYTGQPEKGKPWWPPMQVYQLKDGYGNWDYDELPVWVSQPPVERMLVHSGLYRWDGQITRLWSFDLTLAANERISSGKTDIGLSVRAMTSAAAWPEPHSMGHCNVLYGTACRERDLAPHLYVELEGNSPK